MKKFAWTTSYGRDASTRRSSVALNSGMCSSIASLATKRGGPASTWTTRAPRLELDGGRQRRVVAPREHVDAVAAPRQHARDLVDVDVLAAGIDAAQARERRCVLADQSDAHGTRRDLGALESRFHGVRLSILESCGRHVTCPPSTRLRLARALPIAGAAPRARPMSSCKRAGDRIEMQLRPVSSLSADDLAAAERLARRRCGVGEPRRRLVGRRRPRGVRDRARRRSARDRPARGDPDRRAGGSAARHRADRAHARSASASRVRRRSSSRGSPCSRWSPSRSSANGSARSCCWSPPRS